MVAGLVIIRWARAGRGGLRPGHWIGALAQANLGAVAAGWATLSLLPVPGAQPLPTPVDRWALAALLAISLLLDLDRLGGETRRWRGLAGAGITLAMLAPLAAEQGLLVSEAALGMSWAARLAIFAVGLGIAVLLWSGDVGLGGEVRGLAWLAMSLAPVWTLLPDSWLTPTFAVFLVAGFVYRGAKSVTKIPAPAQLMRLGLATQWLLALGALLLALLLPR